MSAVKTRPFDPAKYLDSDAAIAAYVTEALETGDPSFVVDALGVVARARGTTEAAHDTGVSRKSLQRLLRAEGNAGSATVVPVVRVLGLRLSMLLAWSARNKRRSGRPDHDHRPRMPAEQPA